MTPGQIIHARRAHVLEQAALTDVTAVCKAAGVSHTRYYRRVAEAEKYCPPPLMPTDRRAPVMPDARSTEEVRTILATAVAKRTLGPATGRPPRRGRGAPFGQRHPKVLRRRQLSTRRQRVATLASLTAAETGPEFTGRAIRAMACRA